MLLRRAFATAWSLLATAALVMASACDERAIVEQPRDLEDLNWDGCGRQPDACDGECRTYFWPMSKTPSNPNGYPAPDRPIGCYGADATCSSSADCNAAQRCVHFGNFDAQGQPHDDKLCWPTYAAAQAQLAAQAAVP